MIIQCAILFSFLAAGELIVWLTGIPIPSSIIGMLLLTAALSRGFIKPQSIEKLTNFLLKNLGFFFVPAGIGLMNCLGLLREQWLPIVAATVISTFLTIAATGRTHQIIRRFKSSRHHGLPNK
jgi:holin-like protein